MDTIDNNGGGDGTSVRASAESLNLNPTATKLTEADSTNIGKVVADVNNNRIVAAESSLLTTPLDSSNTITPVPDLDRAQPDGADKSTTAAATGGVDSTATAEAAAADQAVKLKARMDDIRKRKENNIKQVSSSDLAELNKYDYANRPNDVLRKDTVNYKIAKDARGKIERGVAVTSGEMDQLTKYDSILKEDAEKAQAEKAATPSEMVKARDAARAESKVKIQEARKKSVTTEATNQNRPTLEQSKKYLSKGPNEHLPLSDERLVELEGKSENGTLTDAKEIDEFESEKVRIYYQEIDTKLKTDQPLTEEELNDYESMINAEEVRDREDEMENIGNEIIKSNGIATPETRSKMSAFLDKITGGEFSKNGALKSLVDFSGMSDGEKKEATARLQKALEKFTPKDAQFVKRELQVLMQMEFQARAMVRNLTELAHQAWDIKDFINKHKKALDPRMDSGEDLSDQEAANKRMKWTMVMQLLNDKKSQIMQSANSARILHDLYADSKNKIEFKLGLKGHISYIARSVWNRVGGEVNTQIDSMSNDFRTAEGNRRPAESRKGPPLDLTQFKP